jgi:hypothetical protein
MFVKVGFVYIVLFLFSIGMTGGYIKYEKRLNYYENCSDSLILKRSVQIKNQLFADGFKLEKEANFKQFSQYETPIILRLNAASWYHFVFIGNSTSRLIEIRMYDFDEKMVIYEKQWGDLSPEIQFSYIPKFDEPVAFKPVQVNKKMNEICSCFMLFKKSADGVILQKRN